MINQNFAKLTEETQELEFAPFSGKMGNIFYSKLSETQLRSLGYKKIVNEKPTPDDGYAIRFVKYTQDDENIYYTYDQIKIEETPVEESKEVSKIYLRIALIKLGLWDAFDQWMQSHNIDLGDDKFISVKDAWNDALVLNPESETFKTYVEQAKEEFKDVISSEQIDKLFEECRAK